MDISHIQPVEQGGPDIVQNTIAFSQTPHWLFDELAFTIGRDRKLILSPAISETYQTHLPSDGVLRWPSNTREWPHEQFLHHHRRRFATEWGVSVDTL